MSIVSKLTSLAVIIGASFTAAANTQFVFSSSDSEKKTQVVFTDDAAEFEGRLSQLNIASEGKIAQLIAHNKFDAKLGSKLHLQMVAGVDDLLIVGTSSDDALTAPQIQDLGGHIAEGLKATTSNVNASVFVEDIATSESSIAAHLAYGFQLRDYHFDKYLATKRSEGGTVEFISDDSQASEKQFTTDLTFVAQGVHMARDFAWEPGKSVWPQEFVDRVKEQFDDIDNVKIHVLDVDDMEDLNMGALMGVGKGSIHEPKLLIVEYRGSARDEAPIALAGKGITFDTGGISLKGNNGMWAMKSDLSGAAAVAGTLYAVSKRGEKVNVIGLMPLAENMPAEDAIRPGDVLNTMQGTTIEIISTDAEGRLILSDAVYYAQQEYKPRLLLNIATLTGSAGRALSDEHAALITRNFDFSSEIMQIGKRSGEEVWPLPLHPNHFDQLKSDIADIKNSGVGSPGASIGAAVIGTFVNEDLPWIHLDIAGVDWLDSSRPTVPKGAQGWGVRFMDQLVRESVESK